jgi:hypothetical protein
MKTKKCAFTQCEKTFEIKNPKKRFCCLSCKNKAAYEYLLKTYTWEIKQLKARRKNIQILEYLYNQQKLRVTLNELNLLGFEIECAIIAFKNEQKQSVFRFGNILLTIISDNQSEITKI